MTFSIKDITVNGYPISIYQEKFDNGYHVAVYSPYGKTESDIYYTDLAKAKARFNALIRKYKNETSYIRNHPEEAENSDIVTANIVRSDTMKIKRNKVMASANSDALTTLGITADELKIVLTWCYWNDPDSDVGFEDEESGAFITNPFTDPTGRFDLTVSEAIETYGVNNVKYFCDGVLDIINNYAKNFI